MKPAPTATRLPWMRMKKQCFRKGAVGLVFLGVGLAGLLIMANSPVTGTVHRAGFLLAFFASWLGLLLLMRRRRFWVCGLVCVPVLGLALFFLPGKPLPVEVLREDYVRRLVSLEGVPYSWGGETSAGIDCSGLPRKALREALFAHGLKSLDGGALRLAVRHWWYDASAKAMRSGYRGYVQPLAVSGMISQLDHPALLPGDLAITDDGVHVLVYLGKNQWIQADPGLGKVSVLDGRRDANFWFNVPMTACRWSVLSARP